MPHLTGPSAFLGYFEDKDTEAAHSAKPAQPRLASPGPPPWLFHAAPPLSISRDENPTRPSRIHHSCRFLVHFTQWNYLSAHMWATSMDFVSPKRVKKKFYQNETFQEDTICFPNLFFFFRAAPVAHGRSQARGLIGAAAASLQPQPHQT